MSLKASVLTFLAVLMLCTVAVTPANALQPSPKTYVFLDFDGILIDCVDFTKQGNAFWYFSGVKGVFQTMDMSPYTGTPADSFFWGQVQNANLGGWISRKTNFHGVCEAQGISLYSVDGTNTASCAMVSYARYSNPPVGNFNDSWLAIQLPIKCDPFFGFGAVRGQDPGEALKGALRGKAPSGK